MRIRDNVSLPSSEADALDVRGLITSVIQRRELIVGIALFCMAATYLFMFFRPQADYATATLALTFPSISSDRYPSGRAFSQTDIISPPVLSQVTNQLFLDKQGITVPDLQRVISVESLFRVGDKDKGEPAQVPLYQYKIQLRDESLGLSPSDKRLILSSIVENYRKTRQQEFLSKPLFPQLTLGGDGANTLDYPFADEALHGYLEGLRAEVRTMANTAPAFRSTETGQTFAGALRELDTLRDVDYLDLSTRIRTYHMTRDREDTIRRYKTRIREQEALQAKVKQESQYARELLTDAEGLRDVQFAATLPALSGTDSGALLLDRILDRLYQDNFFTNLVQRVSDSGSRSIELGVSIQRYKDEIQRLESGAGNLALIPQVVDQVDKDIVQLVRRLNGIADPFNAMTLEYYAEQSRDLIEYIAVPHSVTTSTSLSTSLWRNVILAGVASFMLSVLAVMGWHFLNSAMLGLWPVRPEPDAGLQSKPYL